MVKQHTNGEDQAKMMLNCIDLYHAKRRMQILDKHPEIRDLMKVDPSFKYVAVACAITKLFIAYLLRDERLGLVIFMGVLVGPFFRSAIARAIHEVTHGLAIENDTTANKIFNGFLNLVLVFPFVARYRISHIRHHTCLGTDLDITFPSMEEARQYDQNITGRLRYMFTHPSIIGERSKKATATDNSDPYVLWNERTVWMADILILMFWGYKSMLFLVLSFFITDVFILATKALSDHWVDESEPHTNSYYGWFNMVIFNIGYHVEHHDFPNITGRYLPLARKIAPEFYSDERYIYDWMLIGVWNMLRAKPGQGLMKHANKLTLKQAQVPDGYTGLYGPHF